MNASTDPARPAPARPRLPRVPLGPVVSVVGRVGRRVETGVQVGVGIGLGVGAAVVTPIATRVLDSVVPPVADALLSRIDLTGAVGRYVDIDALVAGVDIDAIIGRIDLAGLTREVIDEVDLPEIIRDSTGSMASETVRGVRLQTVTADDALDRALDRFRLRKRVSAPVLPDAP